MLLAMNRSPQSTQSETEQCSSSSQGLPAESQAGPVFLFFSFMFKRTLFVRAIFMLFKEMLPSHSFHIAFSHFPNQLTFVYVL